MPWCNEGCKSDTMKEFSNLWKSSKNPRKQRKFRYNAPLHIKRKLFSANLSKDIRKKYNKRNMPIKIGDRVKVVRGNYKGTLGKIDRINLGKERIYVEGTERIKKDGTKSLYPIHPSNVIIQELNLEDNRRKKILERKK